MSTAQQVRDLGPWKMPFRFDGVKTLGERFERVESRYLARKSIFLDPLLRAGFLKGKQVLDLGCNAGYWSIECLNGEAAFVRGIETDAHWLAQATFVREQFGFSADRLDLVRDDIYQHLLGEDTYDVVLCLGLYYHIEEPMRLMRLMHKAARELVIIDTVVNNVPDASISVRPCELKDRWLDVSNIGLEFVASPKAIHWMRIEAGFPDAVMLQYSGERGPWIWDYLREERSAFVLGQENVALSHLFPSAADWHFLTPSEDLAKYGYFPEMRKVNRDGPSVPEPSDGTRGQNAIRGGRLSRLAVRARRARRRLRRRA